MNRLVRTAQAALIGLCLTPLALHAQSAAAPSAQSCVQWQSLTPLQQRITDKAAEGMEPLIQFIQRTRMVYQLDLNDTVAWIEGRRALQLACAGRDSGVSASATAQ